MNDEKKENCIADTARLLMQKPLKDMNIKELETLCAGLRAEIIEAVRKEGGHLASNLGSVELIVAIHYVFDLPFDKAVFDVGHFCYAHKLLSGRALGGLRGKGVSGFCDREESDYDVISSAHSGVSIGTGLGLCFARDSGNKTHKVISVIGDASLASGVAQESLNTAGDYNGQYLIIVNDNGMSIGKSVGGLYKALNRLTVKKKYRSAKSGFKRFLNVTFLGRACLNGLRRVKRLTKRVLNGYNSFEQLGIKYVGAINGHSLKVLISVLKDLKEEKRPVVLHVKTIKGKGYDEAERNPEFYHGVGAGMSAGKNDFAEALSGALEDLLEKEKIIFAITAAMEDGTGLKAFAKKHPDNFIDVGIAEQSAVAIASGIALGGQRAVVCIYSTFLQRAYDQINQEICLMNLPVIFCVDRAGVVGKDGKTHHGAFDISYLYNLPNMKILAPMSPSELSGAIEYAAKLNCPVAIRYPNGAAPNLSTLVNAEVNADYLCWQGFTLSDRAVVALVSSPRLVKYAARLCGTVYLCRTLKPLDGKTLDHIAGKKIFVFEEGAEGGFSSAVLTYYSAKGIKVNLTHKTYPDKFLPHAATDEILDEIFN